MTDRTTDDQPTVGVLNFWSFIELANKRLATEHGFRDQLATEVLLTLNRASNVVTYDLESSIHRPRGWSWSSFRLLFVTWLAGPIEPKAAAELTGMSRAAVSNLSKSLLADGLIDRRPTENDGPFRPAVPDRQGPRSHGRSLSRAERTRTRLGQRPERGRTANSCHAPGQTDHQPQPVRRTRT